MSFFEININYNFKKCYEKKFDSKSKISTALSKKLKRINNALREFFAHVKKMQKFYKIDKESSNNFSKNCFLSENQIN